MRRLGALLPEAAAAVGLEEQLRTGRAAATWERLVAERVPAAAGASRLVELREDEGAIVVSVDRPIVAQEMRLRAAELLEAFARVPGVGNPRQLRVVVRGVRSDRGGRRPDPSDVDQAPHAGPTAPEDRPRPGWRPPRLVPRRGPASRALDRRHEPLEGQPVRDRHGAAGQRRASGRWPRPPGPYGPPAATPRTLGPA